MKCLYYFSLVATFLLLTPQVQGQGSVEAEFDTVYRYEFKSLKAEHSKKILIDAAHNSIYSLSYGKQSAREMLRIMEHDGFELTFTNQRLTSEILNEKKTDLLVIHGIPNNKITLKGEKTEVLYTSPMSYEEVESIGNFVHRGGGLLVFLSHFPGGSGALPLLEAFGVKFRDGYAFHPQYHTSKGGLCGHFLMDSENKMLNLSHSIFQSARDTITLPKKIKFYCGAAVFRNPEDAILRFPKNTINYTPTTSNNEDLEEISDSYAGMIGFQFGAGRVIVCTDQGIFRSLDLLIDGTKIPVTIHDPESDNAGLLLNSIRWLAGIQ